MLWDLMSQDVKVYFCVAAFLIMVTVPFALSITSKVKW